jgi:NAD(P)-dependent dehydrogenase (short-subunit alcohol dehydrogenase family)
MTNELSGHVAIVTGAGKNIGRAIALALAEGGAKVAVNARSDREGVDSVVAEIAAKGGEALAVMADVSDEASVAGLVGLTRALAHDLAGAGVTVNCVAPGLIATARKGPLPQHHLLAKTLAGRQGLPEEVASAVRFLVGPGARYVTGQTLHVNGGAFLS